MATTTRTCLTPETVAGGPSLSLLSRISPSRVNGAGISNSSEPTRVGAKRSAPDDGEMRPTKRRASVNEKRQKDSYAEHQDAFAPWLDGSAVCDAATSREDRLHHELSLFVAYISPSEKERDARRLLVERIEALLRTRWQDANVTLFGSSATGLELTGGDVDLVVAFNPRSKLNESDKKRRLSAMGDLLRKSGVTTWVNRIYGAKVPIITFTTREALGEVSVDISIRNDEDSGPRAIPIVKQFLQDIPALRPLIHAVKAFLSLRGLNDASQSTLSSYAITIMCISFLQRNPSRRPQEFLDNPLENKALGILLMDFFGHYGHDFSYATHYVSATEKEVLTKKSKNWEQKGSAVLAVHCGKIGLIVEAFKQAHHTLQNVPDTPDYRTSSLLSHIYEIPEEMDAKRHALEASVDSGAFAQAVAGCSIENASTRPVSGGVALTNRLDSRNKPPIHLNAGTATPRNSAASASGQNWSGVIQPLPALRWRDSQQQPNPQFQSQFQPQNYANMNFSPLMQANPAFFSYHINTQQNFGNGRGGSRYTYGGRF
ncbi:hypothetical protein EW145_g562 [Phellinidium pouzarii]|uniref:polynucleotide adenylyltransferase n=1 Tax=Phellinidium pouzarii TaxID=167371 RepID=A0A4S4LHZ7_9AGAM|nr:hypothetical protein EW145_g562 [Phellinidium pouzarii]